MMKKLTIAGLVVATIGVLVSIVQLGYNMRLDYLSRQDDNSPEVAIEEPLIASLVLVPFSLPTNVLHPSDFKSLGTSIRLKLLDTLTTPSDNPDNSVRYITDANDQIMQEMKPYIDNIVRDRAEEFADFEHRGVTGYLYLVIENTGKSTIKSVTFNGPSILFGEKRVGNKTTALSSKSGLFEVGDILPGTTIYVRMWTSLSLSNADDKERVKKSKVVYSNGIAEMSYFSIVNEELLNNALEDAEHWQRRAEIADDQARLLFNVIMGALLVLLLAIVFTWKQKLLKEILDKNNTEQNDDRVQ